jgi:hypothetical protein
VGERVLLVMPRLHVRTEESWDGEPVRADAGNRGAALDAALKAWLERLKKAAEPA